MCPSDRPNREAPLRERLKNAEDSIVSDVRACVLLVSDGSKQGSLKFAHKSFMEYLTAEVLAQYVLNRDLQRTFAILSGSADDINLNSARILLRLPESLMFFAELVINNESMKALRRDEMRKEISRAIIPNWNRPRMIPVFLA